MTILQQTVSTGTTKPQKKMFSDLPNYIIYQLYIIYQTTSFTLFQRQQQGICVEHVTRREDNGIIKQLILHPTVNKYARKHRHYEVV